MDIEEVAKYAVSDLLPSKSKSRYKATYSAFEKWCVVKNVDAVTENVMLAYLVERSDTLKSPASLWCEYSMLKTTISLNKSTDISQFSKLIAFLKKKNKGHRPKKSKILHREDIILYTIVP